MVLYAALGGAGLLLLLVMAIAGGFGDHDVPLHEGALDHGDFDGHGGPSPFGTRIIATFLTLFGVGGVIGRAIGWDHAPSSALGVALGVVGAAIVWRFARVLHDQQAESHVVIATLITRPARVSISIPENGVGEVELTAGAEQTAQLARSVDGRAIAHGSEVTIKAVRGSQVVVEVTR